MSKEYRSLIENWFSLGSKLGTIEEPSSFSGRSQMSLSSADRIRSKKMFELLKKELFSHVADLNQGM
jgi:hypothetical protein